MFALYIGDAGEGGAVVAPLKEPGSPAVDLVAPMPYTAFQAMIDPFAPRGMQNCHRAIHLTGPADEAIDSYVALGAEIALVSSPTTQAILFRHGGAVSQIPERQPRPRRRASRRRLHGPSHRGLARPGADRAAPRRGIPTTCSGSTRTSSPAVTRE